jgi:hypothetical protein
MTRLSRLLTGVVAVVAVAAVAGSALAGEMKLRASHQ